MKLFDLAGTSHFVFEPEHWYASYIVEAIFTTTFEQEPLEAYFWAQSTIPSPWNLCWTDTARECRGLDINDPVFRQHWTTYLGAHMLFRSDTEGH